MNFFGKLLALISLLALAACSSSNSPTTLTDANVLDLAVAGTEAEKRLRIPKMYRFLNLAVPRAASTLRLFQNRLRKICMRRQTYRPSVM
ncbi:MAG: hypothetical protein OQL06_01005 [Gammaproteobacteria bacterium]|nr:hypothetical protein [Gammaproteobacteria bacterium]